MDKKGPNTWRFFNVMLDSHDVLHKVFMFLGPSSLKTARLVCKTWNMLLTNPTYWRWAEVKLYHGNFRGIIETEFFSVISNINIKCMYPDGLILLHRALGMRELSKVFIGRQQDVEKDIGGGILGMICLNAKEVEFGGLNTIYDVVTTQKVIKPLFYLEGVSKVEKLNFSWFPFDSRKSGMLLVPLALQVKKLDISFANVNPLDLNYLLKALAACSIDEGIEGKGICNKYPHMNISDRKINLQEIAMMNINLWHPKYEVNEVMKGICCLTSVNMKFARLDTNGWRKLFRCISECTSLTNVNLSNTPEIQNLTSEEIINAIIKIRKVILIDEHTCHRNGSISMRQAIDLKLALTAFKKNNIQLRSLTLWTNYEEMPSASSGMPQCLEELALYQPGQDVCNGTFGATLNQYMFETNYDYVPCTCHWFKTLLT